MRSGDEVRFAWQTATERNTAGFNLLSDGPEVLTPLNDEAIPATGIDTVEPQSYHFVAVSGAEAFYLQEILLDGGTRDHGPFILDQAYGAEVTVDAQPDDPAERLYLPLVRMHGDIVDAAVADSTVITKYYYFGSRRVAMHKKVVDGSEEFLYLHTDHLGSTVMETRWNGVVKHDQKYYAFGSQRDSGPVATDHKFTGQKLDGSGLYYYNARYYDPAIGQFVSPDTIVPDPENVLAYNRYMYTLGNPLKYSDPSGHCVWDGCILEAILVAGLVGGTANATGNIGVQVWMNWDGGRTTQENFTDFNRTEAGIAFGYGAVGGALVPVTGGASAVAANGALGAMQEVTTDMIVDGDSLTDAVDVETAFAFGSGMIGGMVQGKMTDDLIYGLSEGNRLGVSTGLDATAYGGERFAESTGGQLFGEQLKYIFGGRFIMGSTVGNVPTPNQEAVSDCGFLKCPVRAVKDWWQEENGE